MSFGTITAHRVLKAPPDRVFRAFVTASALAKWLPPFGFTCEIDHLDATVGGTFKMAFTNFTTAQSHAFGGVYVEVVPNERLQYTDRFDDPSMQGEIVTTVVLSEVVCGTDLRVTQSGIPAAIPVEMCYLGWQESLAQLATLVEPEIAG